MSEFTGVSVSVEQFNFGDYVEIEQNRYGAPNEMFIHKVVGSFRSNAWVEVPVFWQKELIIHDHSEEVLNVICCGIDETTVYRVRAADCKKAVVSNSFAERLDRVELAEVKARMEAEELAKVALDDTYNGFMANREIEQLRAALEFYAKESTYWYIENPSGKLLKDSRINKDLGSLARKALAGDSDAI